MTSARIKSFSLPWMLLFWVVTVAHQASAQQKNTPSEVCSSSPNPLTKIACLDPYAHRLIERSQHAFKNLARQIPEAAHTALQAHQRRWQLFAEAWFSALDKNSPAPRCASPRALLFQRVESLEKTLQLLRESEAKPKSIDLCYDSGACRSPSGSATVELICETIHLGVEGLSAPQETAAVRWLSRWSAERQPFETRISKSVHPSAISAESTGGTQSENTSEQAQKNAAQPFCEESKETSLVEYVRGQYMTVRQRQSNSCHPQLSQEELKTLDLRNGRKLSIKDFITTPERLLKELQRSNEAELLQALLRHQLSNDNKRPQIEPSECSSLPFTHIEKVNIHLADGGLKISALFKSFSEQLSPCQFKVEESLSSELMLRLLRAKKSTAASRLIR